MGHDLDGLIGFITRDDVWHERLADVLEEHFLPALEAFDLDFEDLGDLLGEDWPMVLWGGGLEDLLGRTFGPDNENAADVYLKRQGSKESAQTHAYIAGLRDASTSLYEVSAIVPGKSMVLTDLLSHADPVTVREKAPRRCCNNGIASLFGLSGRAITTSSRARCFRSTPMPSRCSKMGFGPS
jgi:hypothetical protein